MRSGRRMCRTQLWLLACLVFSSLTSLANGSPLDQYQVQCRQAHVISFVTQSQGEKFSGEAQENFNFTVEQLMSAPNLLRVGTAENIFVECQDCTDGDIKVEINVMNHPTKQKHLASTSVTLTRSNNFQGFGQIKISADDFSKDPSIKQYVYLQAQFPNQLLEHVVLVSFQSGYIFIQTDKTLYTPNSRVHYRMFAVTARMEPVERDHETYNDAHIAIEIVTPENIILPLDPVSLRSGLHSGDYQLGEIVSPGLWKVVAKFYSNPQQSYSAEFEVKEHVLPSFEVKLTPVSPFFFVDSQELTVSIEARYLFGEEVNGMAYVVFGVVQYGQKKSFPSSIQRVPLYSGAGVATLRREQITQTFRNILELVGSSIFVAVSVLTESGSEMVEAELRNIQIVISPYAIDFKKTSKYYKPGVSFDVAVEVLNPDETPAQGVAVVVNPGQVMGLTAENGMARLTINTDPRSTTLTITAKTSDPRISLERQASATMVALPHTTKSNSYIHIDVHQAEVTLGGHLKIQLSLIRQQNAHHDVTYLILSRGQLVKSGSYKRSGHALISLIVPITKEMLPSFRIIAYYHTNDNEVVADSVWVDVKDTCMGSLKLQSVRDVPSYEPRRMFGLKVTGDPGATVGLVAVDKGVYVLNNKHRLTQKKVWDIVETYDTGCTAGGGKDSMGVFYDAGLLFESSASRTPYRLDSKCPTRSRSKRASTIMDLSMGQEDDAYEDMDYIVSRAAFPESWLWTTIQLPSCPRHMPNCDTTSFVKNAPLQDSMTTWEFIGISLSRTHGICVADPLEVIIRKEFFIDLRLPYSAVRGEQLEITAILHNYHPDPITVRVDLLEEDHVCSAAFKLGHYRQEVKVGPATTRSVPFIIIPMREGTHGIRVKAAVKDSALSDGILKMLRVVPEGVLVKSIKMLTLDPAKRSVGGKQEETLNSGIPKRDLIPNTPTSTIISLTGREQIEKTPISGKSMGGLIRQPSGSGESNMIHMTLSVIATVYLDETNQWEAVGFDKRNEALQHINTGYRNELAYRRRDGSFAVWPSHPSSTWLTAYVVKVFSMANNLIPMQSSLICDAVKFLILNTQQVDGMFREVGGVYHGEMIGDVRGTDSDASMTAFCLIAMQESRPLCAAYVNSLPDSIHKAVTYLERRLPRLTNPYAVAMTSYALANENKLNREILYNFASPALSDWQVPKGHIYTLEATAYALLALVKVKAFEDAKPVFRWLDQQPLVSNGYGSTQATIMVFQALAEYWTSAQEQEYDLDVSIHLPGRSRPNRYKINRENHHFTRTAKSNTINEDINVIASGVGEATVKMVSLYYTLPSTVESDCQRFHLSLQLIPENLDQDEKTYKLRIEVMYKDKQRDATMSILDIGLLTGFTVNFNDLDLLSKGRGRTIAKYEMNTVLSERGSLIIYLDKVSHTRPEEITFRIQQKLKVGVLQPAAVSVYEYYEPTQCVKFYHPGKSDGKLLQFCKDGECTCGEEMCGKQRKGKISINDRIAVAGETTPFGTMDFAYKVRMENFTEGSYTAIYTMRIVDVIREGHYDVDPRGELRSFRSYQQCREFLDLQKGKTYLIMGSTRDLMSDYHSQSNVYKLSGNNWIEYWPTEAECQTETHRPACLGIKELVRHITFTCAHEVN